MKKTSLAAALVMLALSGALTASADKKLDDAIAKAEEQFQKGRTEDALKTLQKAASQGDPQALLALARLQQRAGNLDDAGTTLQKAADGSAAAAPSMRAAVLAALSSYKLRTAGAREALKAADLAVQAEAGAASLAARATALARLRDGGALEAAAKAVQAGATAQSHAAHGEALLAAKKPVEAADAFRKALALDPKHAPALAGLALALLESGKGAEAVAEARKATEADAHWGEAFATLGLALLSHDATDKSNEAIAQAQQGAFLEPKNASVKLAVGRIFEARGQLDQAVAAYAEAAQLDPGWAGARLAAINLQYRKGDLDGALNEIRKLSPEAAQSAEVQLLLGKLLMRKGDQANALAALEKAAAALPGSAEAQAAVGTAHYNAGSLEKAAAAYKRATDLDPANDGYLVNYGLFQGYAGKAEEGIAALAKVTARPTYKDANGFINLGYLYRATKPPRVNEAVAAYKRALEIDPKSGQAALGVALAYYGNKQWDEAIGAFGRVPEVDKKLQGDALNGIAWSHFFKKDLAQARAFGDKAKAAGVPDAEELLTAIQKYEEALKAGQQAAAARLEEERRRREEGGGGAGIGPLVAQLRSGNPVGQRRAAGLLCKAGREAVQHLAYSLTNADIGAREVIAACLGAMGAQAREALPMLDRLILEGPPPPNPMASKEESERELRETDLIRTMKDAAARIRR